MNTVHEQYPISDSEAVLSQKLAKCTMCTATAQLARTGRARVAVSQPAQRGVVGAQPAVSQRIGAVSQRLSRAPAPCAPHAARLRAQRPCVPNAPAYLRLPALCRLPERPCAQRSRRVASAVAVLQYSLSYLPHLVTIQLGSSPNPLCTIFFFISSSHWKIQKLYTYFFSRILK